MRLDARKGDLNWTVYHAEECRVLKQVVWIDDETAQWWEHLEPVRVEGHEIPGRLCRARKILILPEHRLVIINPLEDELQTEIKDFVRVAA